MKSVVRKCSCSEGESVVIVSRYSGGRTLKNTPRRRGGDGTAAMVLGRLRFLGGFANSNNPLTKTLNLAVFRENYTICRKSSLML